jgi:hypothetical protein
MTDYIKNFAIPEMIKTFKSLSVRLQRDIVIIIITIFYILLGTTIKIPSIDYSFNYKGNNIFYLLALFIFFYISASVHLLKIFILYRQIDDEVRAAFTDDSVLANKIEMARSMIAFTISENITSDLILSGHKRIPSLKRVVCLQLFLITAATLIIFKMLNDVIANPKLALSISVGGNLIGQYLITKYLFIKRSAFINKSQLGKDAFLSYFTLLNLLNKYEKDNKNEKLKSLLSQKTKKLLDLQWGNLFDDERNLDTLSKDLKDINNFINSLSEADKHNLLYYEAFEDQRDSMIDGAKNVTTRSKYRLECAIDHFGDYKTMSEYEFALRYHLRTPFTEKPNNIFSYVFYALKS